MHHRIEAICAIMLLMVLWSIPAHVRFGRADPTSRSTLGFNNLQHRSSRVQNWGDLLVASEGAGKLEQHGPSTTISGAVGNRAEGTLLPCYNVPALWWRATESSERVLGENQQ